MEFAFGTDNGTIQRWDFRHNRAPKQNITAHDQRMCTSIDWHPDGKHLLSAGVDRTVKVWDFSVVGRRQKPAWVLNTPYPVHKAKWRPPYWSNEHHEKGSYQCTQIATSYDREHPIIHVWDFRRPFLPFREINKFSTAPSDMLWHSRDTLWTVGKEGVFQQNDVHHAPKTVERRNLQAFAISPTGELGGVAQKRLRRPPSTSLAYSNNAYANDPHDTRSSPEKGSLRSSADDTLDDSFLISSIKRHHGRSASSRSTKSFSSTPPSDTAPKVMFLTDSITMHSESCKPNQLAFRGALPGPYSVQVFAYLAQKYKAILLSDPPTLDSFLEIGRVFEQNAEYAQRAALYRLAQTWRVVGASIVVTTRRRAELHSKSTRSRHKSTTSKTSLSGKRTDFEQLKNWDGRHSVPPNPAVRAILGTLDKPGHRSPTPQELNVVESTSNLATPLARPTTTGPSTSNGTQKSELPDLDHEEISQLPPAVNGPQVTPSSSLSDQKPLATPQLNFGGSQLYHSAEKLDERRALVSSWRASPRTPLSFKAGDAKNISVTVPPPLERHHSGDSFTMFSASTDSHTGSSFAESSLHSQSMDLDSRSFGLEKSSFGNPRATTLEDVHDQKDESALNSNSDAIATKRVESNIDSDYDMLEYSSGDRAVHEMQHLHRNNQLMRQDSSESDAYSSSRDSLFASSFEHNVEMEASGTIVPEMADEVTSPQGNQHPVSQLHAAESARPVPDPADDTALLLSDFQALHIDAEAGSPYSMIGLLKTLLAYHTSASDAQFASLLLLLLAPIIPQTQKPSSATASDVGEVLTAFTDTFISLGLTPTQAKAILSTHLSQLIATGINPYQAEAILHTYHGQLHSLALFNSAASLRRLAYPTYPAVYEQALKDTQLGLMCLSCKSPINNPKDKMRCESCRRAQAPCPICWGKYPAFEPVTAKKKVKAKLRSSFKDLGHKRERSSLIPSQPAGDEDLHDRESPSVPLNWSPPTATLWTWCPLCGHGGHTNCLSTWFADPAPSGGACATEGCLCDCVQGRHRDDRIQEVLRKKAEKERSKVVRKGDDWKVNESKAVSAVRNAALDTISGQAAQATVGRREDNKRVRMVAPEHSP